jgi:tetratricopeptide (TPR) repeat protein
MGAATIPGAGLGASMTAEELVDDIQRRLDACAAGDLGPVVDEQAKVNREALWAAEYDGIKAPIHVFQLVGWLSWYRYLSLPDGEEGGEFYQAARMFAALSDTGAEVPEALGWYLPMSSGRRHSKRVKVASAGIWLVRATFQAMYTDAPITVRQAIKELPDRQFPVTGPYSYLVTILSDLGASLGIRFLRTHATEDIDQAVDVLRFAVERIPPGHPERWLALTNLGTVLEERSRRTGLVSDMDDAVAAFCQAAEVAPPGVDRDDLAETIVRFQHGGGPSGLDHAIEARRRAVDRAPDGRGRAELRAQLAGELLVRFERTQRPDDLRDCIQESRAAIAALPDELRTAECLSNLGLGLYLSSERSGDLDDLDHAIAVFRQSVARAGDGSLSKAILLTRLGLGLSKRFDWAGNPADLEEAIAVGREALAASQDPEQHPNILSNLAGTLNRAFEVSGRLPYLEEAFTYLREALDLSPVDSPYRAAYLTNLASALRYRFNRIGDIADLDESIECSRAAVDAVPVGHLERADYESSLSGRLRARFERLHDPSDLDEAITIGRRAVESMPLTDPWSAERLSTLFGALRMRYEHARNPADLEEAIAVGRRAVDASLADDSARPRRMANLAVGLWIRFEHAGDLSDLEEALDLGRQAIEATPPLHPDRARYLYGQGRMRRVRFERLGLAEDATAAIGMWREAARMPIADTYSRLEAAYHWGRLAATMGNWPEAVHGYAAAVELLPLLAWRGAARRSREQLLSDWPSLARDAGACAVMAQQPELGLQLLEQGRGVLWSDLLDVNADLAALHQAAGELAERLETCRATLDLLATGPESGQPVSGLAEAMPATRSAARGTTDSRMALAREWDELVEQVRAIDGFEDFLRPARPEALLAAAANGPVVVINVSRWRCDALIVTADGVRVEELPRLSAESVTSKASEYLRVLQQLERAADDLHSARELLDQPHHGLDAITHYTAAKKALRDAQRDRDQVLAVVLGWLWDEICDPVLTALGFVGSPGQGQSWPRLWWCPTGLLTLLPLHAAGHYDASGRSSGRAVLDRVVSSYTPTLRALLETRRPLDPPPDSNRMLVVALAETPGELPLADVARERELLTSLFARRHTVLAGPAATWAAVRAELPRHRWVHCSCHGGQDLEDPSRGGLVLHDRLLSVADFSTGHYRGEFAFLSACMTATGGVDVPDEVITLAAALHYTGYRHVIGTLWSVYDTIAADIAEGVYAELAVAGQFDAARSAYALHNTIRMLRDDDQCPPSSWAPFAHTGP